MSSNPTVCIQKQMRLQPSPFSFLPIIRAFTKSSGIEVGLKTSHYGRILSQFPESL